jgi:hypothetical protein
MPRIPRLIIIGATATIAAVPAVIGLAGNPSFSQSVPVRTPPQVQVASRATTHAGDDRGRRVELGDDRRHALVSASPSAAPSAALSASPSAVPSVATLRSPAATFSVAGIPADDHGRHAEPGDDRGVHAEPGDDRGGQQVAVQSTVAAPSPAPAATKTSGRDDKAGHGGHGGHDDAPGHQ